MAHLDPVPRLTERVALRRLCRDDLRAFQAYRLDPVVGQYQGWSPMSDAQALSFLDGMNAATALTPGEWFQIGIADRRSNTLIGDIGVRISGDGLEAEIGFTLGRSHQGQGLAREAVGEVVALIFKVTSAQRVVAVTDARNDSARKLLSMLGMAHVGEQAAIFRGEPCVEDTFALDKGAWRQRERQAPSSMHPTLRAAFDGEMNFARRALAEQNLSLAFVHFERAHILGQWYVRSHVLAHVGMLRIGCRRRDLREVLGQLLRIPGGAIGSALGRVPRGNTGGARVSAFRELPIPPDLQELLMLDKRSR